MDDNGDTEKASRGVTTSPLAKLLLVLATIGLIGALVWPGLTRRRGDREDGVRVKCGSNLRQIGQAILLYSFDNHGRYPPNLSTVLATQDITSEVFTCPMTNDTWLYGDASTKPTTQQIIDADPLATGHHCSYIYVGNGLTNESSAEVVVAFEPVENHEHDGSNVLYADGHVSYESEAVAEQLRDDFNAGVRPILTRPPAVTGGR